MKNKESSEITVKPSDKDNTVEKFLNKNNVFAVIGVSKDPDKYGNIIYHELKSAGYHVYPINPNADSIDGEKCYASLNDLPKLPDVIDIVVSPKIAEKVVKEAINLGVKKVWLQPGSESEKLIRFCEDNGILVLHNICIMIERKNLMK